jgi:hypothetical protein
MPLPFALTIPQLLAAVGLGGVVVAAAGAESSTMKEIKKQRIKTAKVVGALGPAGKPQRKKPKWWPKGTTWPPVQPEGAGEFEFPTGPLPQAARDAWNAKKHGRGRSRSAYGKNNDIHKKDGWFRFATYSDKWDRKHEKIRYYAKPNGALYVRKHGKAAMVGNLCWMARCPDSWYPGYGRAKALNVRLPALKPLLGPKADWKTLSNSVKTSIKNIPAVLKAAAVVVAGIYSGGASVQKNPEKQLDTVGKGIKGAIEPMADAGKESDSRVGAGRVIVTAIRKQYILQMMVANPWAVKNGKLDLGRHYMADPKTWEDLFKPGKSRPLLYNPPKSK